MADTRMFSVDKFLGLNQSGDGDTELKMGEASLMVNFTVTDGMNLASRPGVLPAPFDESRAPGQLLAVWAGYVGTAERIVLVELSGGTDRITVYGRDSTGNVASLSTQSGLLALTDPVNVQVFSFSGDVYIFTPKKFAVLGASDAFTVATPYVPLVIAGASPSGGGTELEKSNLLSPRRRVDYSADGTSTAYVLPAEAASVVSVAVDNAVLPSPGSFDAASHTFNFTSAPAKGVGNVEITYSVSEESFAPGLAQIAACTLHEEFNGSTDTRLFLSGDGSNRCYYSGVTQDGTPSALYFPALNEIAVDVSGSAVTAMVRHYSRLLVFKPDGTFAITYEPVTLADGSVTAGFYLRPVNRDYGNSAPGQVRTVSNYPRSFTASALYEWRVTSSYYRDERYAVRISDPVRTAIAQADPKRLLAWDDDAEKTYYIFLNDTLGTVLVNRYGLGKSGLWTVYRSGAFRDVTHAFTFASTFYFVSGGRILHFSESALYDNYAGESVPIDAAWESGFMAFGADFLKKYASSIYVSVLPQSNSSLSVTAETDRKSSYTEKTVSKNIFAFSTLRFSNLTFRTKQSPTISRVRLKVKKFVYYKLKFSVSQPGTRAVVLGFDMEVRYGAKAK
ncbi:MAG: hypothetical protein PUH63_02145 [Firmicutes bacterium]|nr:hypothetical protein [Bacillota bacterium]